MYPSELEPTIQWMSDKLNGFVFDGFVGDIAVRAPQEGCRAAAVMIPLVWREEGISVILTRRTESLSQHPGQVSFPGGKIDEVDQSAVHAAIREANEEIGLDEAKVRLVGILPEYVTITNFTITPVVTMLQPPLQLIPAEHEVAEIFEVPLSLALDLAQYSKHYYIRDGLEGHYFALHWNGYRVWGATAAMLRLLAQALSQ